MSNYNAEPSPTLLWVTQTLSTAIGVALGVILAFFIIFGGGLALHNHLSKPTPTERRVP